MSQHKFFSGLPPKMENRAGHGPNRLQTQFYWPEDANRPDVAPSKHRALQRRMSRTSSKDSGDTTWDARNYDTDVANKAIRERKNKQLQSRIEFYDTIDDDTNKIKENGKKVQENNNNNDVNEQKVESKVKNDESVNESQNQKNSIEKVVERVHEINLEDTPPQKQPNGRNYDSNESDEEMQLRERHRMKKNPMNKRQDSWEEYESREIRRPPPSRRPPRSNYDYEEDYYYYPPPPPRGMSRERYRRAPDYYDDYDSRPVGGRPPMSPRRYDDYVDYDGPPTPRKFNLEPDYEPIDRDFYYEEPATQRESVPSSPKPKPTQMNGNASPIKRNLVKRAMSVCSDCPSEISRAMSQRHLKSNIFFTDKEALATTPRPRTVRDSAVNRVCVGLPDIE